jgi:hypothetical protein
VSKGELIAPWARRAELNRRILAMMSATAPPVHTCR